jgi:hypothetical protein
MSYPMIAPTGESGPPVICSGTSLTRRIIIELQSAFVSLVLRKSDRLSGASRGQAIPTP